MFHKAYSKRDMTPDKNDFETYFLLLMRDLYSCGLSSASLLVETILTLAVYTLPYTASVGTAKHPSILLFLHQVYTLTV